jgi:gluconolactonase
MRSFICGIAVFAIAAGTIRAQDMPLSQIIDDGEDWKELASGFPRIDLLRDTSKGIAAYHSKGVERITPSGKRSVADDAEDIQRPTQVQTTRGPAYMIRDGEKPIVYCLKPLRSPVATPGIKRPAGLTLSASEGSLVVGDAAGKYLWAYRIDKNGALSAGEPYYPLRVNLGQTESGVTALTTDAAGRVYACTPLGVQVFDPTGRLCGVLLKPGEGDMTAITFTGENREVLVVACGDKIFVRKMLAKGKPADR